MERKNKEEEKIEGFGKDTEIELEAEIKAGEWRRLREFKTYRKRSRQGKIIATHQAISNRLKQLETLFYQLAANHPQKAQKMLAELKRLRYLQEFLLQSLIWEEQGQLDNRDMPDELEEII